MCVVCESFIESAIVDIAESSIESAIVDIAGQFRILDGEVASGEVGSVFDGSFGCFGWSGG